MKYNIKFEQDCKKIKLITDVRKRAAAIKSIATAYGISRATVHRHLKQNIPSLRIEKTCHQAGACSRF